MSRVHSSERGVFIDMGHDRVDDQMICFEPFFLTFRVFLYISNFDLPD